MPGSLLNADIAFPDLKGEESSKAKFEKIEGYLYMLLEELRYSFGNLGAENFNSSGLEEIANIITEPIYAQLYGEEGDITTLMATSEGLSARIEGAEGAITSLAATSEGLSSRVEDAEGAVSTLTQRVYGMTLSVANGQKSSTLKLMADGVELSSARIAFTGTVTFNDLSTEGSTLINGSNIRTGTISAMNLSACNIEGSTFRSILDDDGNVGGEIEMCYIDPYLKVGGIRLDDEGAGSQSEGRYRMFIYTKSVGGVPFHMKLESGGGMSLEAAMGVYISGDTASITAEDIYLTGNVYINGEKIS